MSNPEFTYYVVRRPLKCVNCPMWITRWRPSRLTSQEKRKVPLLHRFVQNGSKNVSTMHDTYEKSLYTFSSLSSCKILFLQWPCPYSSILPEEIFVKVDV